MVEELGFDINAGSQLGTYVCCCYVELCSASFVVTVLLYPSMEVNFSLETLLILCMLPPPPLNSSHQLNIASS